MWREFGAVCRGYWAFADCDHVFEMRKGRGKGKGGTGEGETSGSRKQRLFIDMDGRFVLF